VFGELLIWLGITIAAIALLALVFSFGLAFVFDRRTRR
jgi:hypothetical protein